MTKKMRKTTEDIFVFLAAMIMVVALVSAFSEVLAGSTRVKVIDVQKTSDQVVERHKRGAYIHTYEYEATRYSLHLMKEDGEEIFEDVVVKNDNISWAEETFKIGNILEYSNLEGLSNCHRVIVKKIE